jgi:hypothetical protein
MPVSATRLFADDYVAERRCDQHGAGVGTCSVTPAGRHGLPVRWPMPTADDQPHPVELRRVRLRRVRAGVGHQPPQPGRLVLARPGARTSSLRASDRSTRSSPRSRRDGRPAIVFGTMGGDAQAQVHVQPLAPVDDGCTPVEARSNARGGGSIRTRGGSTSSRADRASSPSCGGHEVLEAPAWDSAMGHAHVIASTPTATSRPRIPARRAPRSACEGSGRPGGPGTITWCQPPPRW